MSRHPPTTSHNYEAGMAQAAKAIRPRPGQVYVLSVLHDDWCDIYKGRFCNCKPDFVTTWRTKPSDPPAQQESQP